MASVLMSDAPYASWLSDVLATLEEHKIDRIAVQHPYRMARYSQANVQADAVLDAVCHNGQRIRQAWENDEDGEG